MMKIFATFAGLLAMTGVAAAADAPAGGLYVGGTVGMVTSNMEHSQTATGLVAGYNFNQYVGVEAAYDHNYAQAHRKSGDTVFVNGTLGMPAGNLKPFVLAGVGQGFNGQGSAHGKSVDLYNVGAGVAYEISKNLETEVRYRRVNQMNDHHDGENVVSLGVNYKF